MDSKKNIKIEDETKSFSICKDKLLGRGSYSTVYFGIDNKTGESVAVKIMNLKNFPEPVIIALQREIDILKEVKSQNIVELKHVIKQDGSLYMFMEYCNGPNLYNLLTRYGKISQEKSIGYLRDFVNGYKQLYSRQYVHRDIKPENLILNENQLKIADFGFARRLPKDELKASTQVGSPLYMAPQVLNEGHAYTDKCDVWSLGISFYEMLFGDTPWPASTEEELQNALRQKPFIFPMRETLFEFSPEISDLLNRMLKYEEKDRISWPEIFEHPLITGDSKTNHKMDLAKSIMLQSTKVPLKPADIKQIENKITIISVEEVEPKVKENSNPNEKSQKINEIGTSLVRNSDKKRIRIIEDKSISNKELEKYIEQAFQMEKKREKLLIIKQLLTENMNGLCIYLKLLVDTENLFVELELDYNINKLNILHYTLNHAFKLLNQFSDVIEHKENSFKLENWNEFITDNIYEEVKKELSLDFEFYQALLNEYKESTLEIKKKRKEYKLSSSIYEDTPIPLDETIKFLAQKLKEYRNCYNKNLLAVIDSLILLEFSSGNPIQNQVNKTNFDYSKFNESQNNIKTEDFLKHVQISIKKYFDLKKQIFHVEFFMEKIIIFG